MLKLPFSGYWLLILPILLFMLTPTGRTQTENDFVGQWVMTLGQRTFLVLTIASPKEGQSSISGFIVRPQHFGTNDGHSFYGIDSKTVQEPIAHSERKDSQITITVQNPMDPSDQDTYQISLADSSHLKLKMGDSPYEPAILTKAQTPSTPATDWDVSKTYPNDDSADSSPEMQRIFEEDQKVRQPGVKIDWTAVSKSDAERREATRRLLSDGKLNTGEDFERAAFVFQHGSTPNDYLLAHTLAMIAVKKGRGNALWIASATLDRYLQAIHQQQIYGTQFFTRPNEPTTQEPYDRTLISDPLRRQLGVPSQPSQDERRKQYDADRNLRN
jgi:hypothetical protein